MGVVEEVDAPRRLSFWWVPTQGDDAPSMVELELIPHRLETARSARCSASARRASTAHGVVEGLLRGPLARARA